MRLHFLSTIMVNPSFYTSKYRVVDNFVYILIAKTATYALLCLMFHRFVFAGRFVSGRTLVFLFFVLGIRVRVVMHAGSETSPQVVIVGSSLPQHQVENIPSLRSVVLGLLLCLSLTAHSARPLNHALWKYSQQHKLFILIWELTKEKSYPLQLISGTVRKSSCILFAQHLEQYPKAIKTAVNWQMHAREYVVVYVWADTRRSTFPSNVIGASRQDAVNPVAPFIGKQQVQLDR